MTVFLILCLAAAVAYGLALVVLRDPHTNLRLSSRDLNHRPLRVPRGFLWGSATSAHQVEGYCTANNWNAFESTRDAAGRPRILGGQTAGAAADHWNRYRDDIALMKALSLNAYRFSVEWSKIEPAEGMFDAAALDHYVSMVRDLRDAGIEPMATLHHFTNPLWFEERGAFLRDDAPATFARFAGRVARELGSEVRLWVTVNEPTVYALNGYLFGDFPPAVRNPRQTVTVLRNVLRAHTEAYRTIKTVLPDSEVGPALNLFVFDPPSPWNLLDVITSRLMAANTNDALLRYLVDGKFRFGFPGIAWENYDSGIPDSFDFIGLNYYTRFRKRLYPFGDPRGHDVVSIPDERKTDMDWEIYPSGLYRILHRIRSITPKPIYITENGLADDTDTKRAQFIEDHLRAMNAAITDGIDVRGYFYWSLMDNFEWSFGFSKRFGLYHVDFETQRRALRQGSRKLVELINAFSSLAPEQQLRSNHQHTSGRSS
jgi:beta-glucosidase